jgi:hypothetical protein
MTIKFLATPPPETPFAPSFRIPIYDTFSGADVNNIAAMNKYVLDMERKIIKHERLISDVPKSKIDPYEYTQHWKQHNLLDDTPPPADDGTIIRFPKDPSMDYLFKLLRRNYLQFLKETGHERRKVWIHCWANILREGEFISPHTHALTADGYLAGTLYLSNSPGNFQIYKEGTIYELIPSPGHMILFPSCLTHYSDKHIGRLPRVSLAFDIVVESMMKTHQHRPHMLFDDPETMKGL